MGNILQKFLFSNPVQYKAPLVNYSKCVMYLFCTFVFIFNRYTNCNNLSDKFSSSKFIHIKSKTYFFKAVLSNFHNSCFELLRNIQNFISTNMDIRLYNGFFYINVEDNVTCIVNSNRMSCYF